MALMWTQLAYLETTTKADLLGEVNLESPHFGRDGRTASHIDRLASNSLHIVVK